jgi:hypothetical protein
MLQVEYGFVYTLYVIGEYECGVGVSEGLKNKVFEIGRVGGGLFNPSEVLRAELLGIYMEYFRVSVWRVALYDILVVGVIGAQV